MRYLTLQDVSNLHNKMIEQMQGLQGANPQQIKLLDSALMQIQNDDYYPLFLDKLTHLIFACVKFHPFLDGNKRTALLISRAFIMMNHPELLVEDFYLQLEDVIVEVASGEISKEKLKEILKNVLNLV